jgi:hypothetical protein
MLGLGCTWAAAGLAHEPGFLNGAARPANGAIGHDFKLVSRTRANARVQLRAVGPTGAERVAVSISVQAFNRNDFLRFRARQLQRRLARSLEEGG